MDFGDFGPHFFFYKYSWSISFMSLTPTINSTTNPDLALKAYKDYMKSQSFTNALRKAIDHARSESKKSSNANYEINFTVDKIKI